MAGTAKNRTFGEKLEAAIIAGLLSMPAGLAYGIVGTIVLKVVFALLTIIIDFDETVVLRIGALSLTISFWAFFAVIFYTIIIEDDAL